MGLFGDDRYSSRLTSVSRFALFILAAGTPIFFLPFTALPVGANKEIFIFGLILIALLGFLIDTFLKRRNNLNFDISTFRKSIFRNPFLLALVLLVFVWFLSSLFGVAPIASFIGSWSVFDSFTAIFLFSVLVILVSLILEARDIVKSIFLFIGGACLAGILNILQFSRIFILPWSFTKIESFNPVGSVNDLAILMGFGLFLAVGLQMGPKPPRFLRLFLIGATAIFIINLILINFLSVWVGLALAMFILIAFTSYEVTSYEVQLRKISWLPFGIVFLALVFIFVPISIPFFYSAPQEVSLSHELSWRMGWNTLLSSRFLFGSGPNTFNYDYHLQKPQNINDTIFWNTEFNQGASVLSTWFGAVGLAGILAILFLIGAFVWTGFRFIALSRGNQSGVSPVFQTTFSGVVFMIILWFAYSGNFTNMALTFWGLGLFLASISAFGNFGKSDFQIGKSDFPNMKEWRGAGFASAALIFLTLISAGLIIVEWRRYAAQNYFSKAVDLGAESGASSSINYLTQAIKFWSYDDRYWRFLSQALLAQLNSPSQFQNITNSAIEAAKRAGELNPVNPANFILLGEIYKSLIPSGIEGVRDKALNGYSKAIALYPQNPSYYVSLAGVYIAEADLLKDPDSIQNKNNLLNQAAGQLKKSLEAKKDFSPALSILIQVFDRQGKIDDAVNTALKVVRLNPLNPDGVFQLGFLYYKNNQFNEAQANLERVIELNPNYSNARYFLGLTYDKLGLASKARSQFQRIIQTDPREKEIEKILINLGYGRPALYGITNN